MSWSIHPDGANARISIFLSDQDLEILRKRAVAEECSVVELLRRAAVAYIRDYPL